MKYRIIKRTFVKENISSYLYQGYYELDKRWETFADRKSLEAIEMLIKEYQDKVQEQASNVQTEVIREFEF